MAGPTQKGIEEEMGAQSALDRLRMARAQRTQNQVQAPPVAAEQVRNRAMQRIFTEAYTGMAQKLAQKDPEAAKALAGSQLAMFFDPRIKRTIEG